MDKLFDRDDDDAENRNAEQQRNDLIHPVTLPGAFGARQSRGLMLVIV